MNRDCLGSGDTDDCGDGGDGGDEDDVVEEEVLGGEELPNSGDFWG